MGIVIGGAVFSVLSAVVWSVLRCRRHGSAYSIMFSKKSTVRPKTLQEVHVMPVTMTIPKTPAPLPNKKIQPPPMPKCPIPAARDRLIGRGRNNQQGGRHRNESPSSSSSSSWSDDDRGLKHAHPPPPREPHVVGLGPPRPPPLKKLCRPQRKKDAELHRAGSRQQHPSVQQASQSEDVQSPHALQCEKGPAILQELQNTRCETLESRRSKFRKLCLQYHPDKTGRASSAETFQYLQEQKGWYLRGHSSPAGLC